MARARRRACDPGRIPCAGTDVRRRGSHMRRLTPLWITFVLLAGGPAAAPAAVRPVALTSPTTGGTLAAQPLADVLSADVPLRGTAARGATIEVRAGCVLAACVTTARADARGRWVARLHPVLDPHRRTLRLAARYAGTARWLPLASFVVALPDWAANPPYLGDPGAPALAVIGDSLA